MKDHVIILGGGHNGLTAAATLAKAGRKVTLVEARDELGGLAGRSEFAPGYTAPGCLHDSSRVRPAVVSALGLEAHGLARESKPWEISFASEAGRAWIAGAQSGGLGGPASEAWTAYNAFIARVRTKLEALVDGLPPNPLGPMWPLILTALGVRRLGGKDMTELLRIGPMCVADWMRDLFADERLAAAAAVPALTGAFTGPWSPGSAINLVLHACSAHTDVAGGPAALSDALVACAKANGATLRAGAKVARLVVGAGGVEAVELADGERIEATTVLSTIDPRTTLIDLIGAQWLPYRLAHDAARIRVRGTTAKIHLALNGPLEMDGSAIEGLRTADSLDNLERAFDAAKYRELPTRPALDVRVPSMRDSSLAPDKHHVVSILAHAAPHDLDGGWTDEARSALGRNVIEVLAERCPTVRDRIVAHEVLTPADLEARYGCAGGHLLHGEHAPDQLLFMRPTIESGKYRTPVNGLWLGGSGSHPGGGITCGPGYLSAKALLKG